MAKARRIDFSPGDWIGGTLELSLEEEGLYIRICALIWNRGGRIHEDLLRAATKEHWSKVKAILARLDAKGKIIRNGLEIGQKRAENELENAEIRRRKAAENGPKGGRPKGLEKADGLISENPRAQYPSPSPPPPEEEPPHTPRKRGAAVDGFEEWWEVYPHKIGKGGAKAKYAIARRKASLAELIAGVERYIATKPDDIRWANPATWLHNERWTDEPAASPLENGKTQQQGLANGLASTPDEQWRRRLTDYKKSKFWIPSWGFPPNDPDCYAPVGLLKEFGFVENAIR